jgi:hypothetical protein
MIGRSISLLKKYNVQHSISTPQLGRCRAAFLGPFPCNDMVRGFKIENKMRRNLHYSGHSFDRNAPIFSTKYIFSVSWHARPPCRTCGDFIASLKIPKVFIGVYVHMRVYLQVYERLFLYCVS